MLKMRCLVLGFFQLILGVLPKLILEVVNEGLKTSKIFLKESFKLKLYDKSGAFMVALMLSSSEIDGTIEIGGDEEGIIYLYSI